MIRSISWLGVRTDRLDSMVDFYRNVMGIEPGVVEDDFVLYELPNGDRLELFGPGGPNAHFGSAPVAGFEVDDVDSARALLENRGVEFVYEGRDEAAGVAWAHFRAPDGNLYEITHQKGHPPG